MLAGLGQVEVPPELVLLALLAEKDEAALLRHPPGGQVAGVAGQVGAAKADLLRSPGEERLERSACDALSSQFSGDVRRGSRSARRGSWAQVLSAEALDGCNGADATAYGGPGQWPSASLPWR